MFLRHCLCFVIFSLERCFKSQVIVKITRYLGFQVLHWATLNLCLYMMWNIEMTNKTLFQTDALTWLKRSRLWIFCHIFANVYWLKYVHCLLRYLMLTFSVDMLSFKDLWTLYLSRMLEKIWILKWITKSNIYVLSELEWIWPNWSCSRRTRV